MISRTRKNVLPTSESMRFSLLNPRSVRNKTLSLKDLTVDRNIDVFAVIETWLSKETKKLKNSLYETSVRPVMNPIMFQ